MRGDSSSPPNEEGDTLGEEPESRDEWLGALRQRLVAVARRRVPEEAVDDVVQDTLRVVYEKGFESGPPDVAWCFQVLRNTIGNHYQKQRVRARDIPPEHLPSASDVPTPLEALEREESSRMIRDCLRTLQRSDAPCTRYLERLLEGSSPAEIAADEHVTAAVLYRRVYRCRAKLRVILRSKGVLA